MSTRPRPIYVLAMAACLSLAAPGSGRGQTTGGTLPPLEPEGGFGGPAEGPALTFLRKPLPPMTLSGETVGELCERLMDLSDGALNIVVKQPAGAIVIPDANMRNASALAALDLVSHLVDGVEIMVDYGSGFTALRSIRQLVERDGSTKQLAGLVGKPTVMILVMGGKSSMAGTRSTQVYNVAPLLKQNDLNIEDLASSLELAWEQHGGGTPSLRFHEETGLLFCSGDGDQLGVADQVLAQFAGGREVLVQSLQARPGDESSQWLKQLTAYGLPTEDREAWERRLQQQEAQSQAELDQVRARLDEREHIIRELSVNLEKMELQARATAETEAAKRAQLLEDTRADANRELERLTAAGSRLEVELAVQRKLNQDLDSERRKVMDQATMIENELSREITKLRMQLEQGVRLENDK